VPDELVQESYAMTKQHARGRLKMLREDMTRARQGQAKAILALKYAMRKDKDNARAELKAANAECIRYFHLIMRAEQDLIEAGEGQYASK